MVAVVDGATPRAGGPDPLFAGIEGRVARDMAAVDWAATPLGPPAGWPRALRTVVRLLLTSRFAMWMAWGPELTMFYNDAYQRDTLRSKHPWALGRPSSEVWAEVWDEVAERVRTVLEDGRSTWDTDLELYLERRGRSEETYHTFSYSPLADDDGVVRGLLCVVAETTEGVLARRRLEFLRELATARATVRSTGDVVAAVRAVVTADHRDLPFALLYLADRSEDLRLVAGIGVPTPGPAAPAVVGPGAGGPDDHGGSPWPLSPVPATTGVVPVPPALAAAVPPTCDRVALVPLLPGAAPTAGDGDDPTGPLGVLGVLVLGLSRHQALDDRYRDFVGLVAAGVSSGLLDARAAEAQRRVTADERLAAARLALVHRATAAFSAAATPEEVAAAAVEHVVTLLPAAQVTVYEYDDVARALTVLAVHPPDDHPGAPGQVVPVEADRVITRAVRGERPLWVHEPVPGEDPADQDPELLALMRGRGLTKVVALPLTAGGRVVGGLAVGLAARGRLDDGERTTLQALAEPSGVAVDRARLYRAEAEIARTLQRSLLPQGLPVIEGLPIAVRYVPGAAGTSAGGDWYDVVAVDATHVAVVVGDVVGQGAAAAAVMGQLRTALSGYLLAGHRPGPALDLLDGLVARVPGARASTAICLVVDTGTGELTWARAGHLPALVVSGPEARLLTDPAGHGPLLGLGAAHPRARTEGTTVIEPGDTVVLYTDGLVERRGESLDEGLDRLVTVAAAGAGAPPEGTASALLEGLAPSPSTDDVAVVVVRLGPRPLVHRFPADPAELAVLRRTVARWAAAAGLGRETLEDLQLALGEAATNAVEHAWGRCPPPGAEVVVTLGLRPDGGVTVGVSDDGAWRPVPADPGHRGRGLTLIRAMADDVVVDGGPGGTRVDFALPGAGPGAPSAPAPAVDEAVGRPVEVRTTHGSSGPVVVVTGDLDLAGARELGRRLADPALAPGGHAIDVRGIGHLTSSGVGLLLAAAERGARLVLPTSGPAARVLALCGLAGPAGLA